MDISAAELSSRLQESNLLRIIDVRERLEFNTFNIGGTNIPLGILIKDSDDLDFDLDEEIITVCRHGLRSETAKRILCQHGYKNVRNLTGGLVAIQKLKSQTSTREND